MEGPAVTHTRRLAFCRSLWGVVLGAGLVGGCTLESVENPMPAAGMTEGSSAATSTDPTLDADSSSSLSSDDESTSGAEDSSGASCVPATCETLGSACGPQPDGCDGTLDCGLCSPCDASNDCELITSMEELRDAFGTSDGRFRMKPGSYTAAELLADEVTILRTTANNSLYDFSDVTIDLPTELLSTMSGATHTYASWKIEGNNNTFVNGTFINTYPDGADIVTDFVAHNEDQAAGRAPGGSSTYVRVWGDGNQLLSNTITVRGSFPYGYGDMFGKGAGATFGLKKQSGIQVVGDQTLIDGLNLTQRAFGHAIFMQGSDGTVIRDTTITGGMREGAEMYDDGPGSLPAEVDYLQQHPSWYEGVPIVAERMYNLTEDGIRAYATGTKLDGSTADTGSITVEDTTITNTRHCIALTGAAGPTRVENVELHGCLEGGFTVSDGGEVINSRGDAAFAPLIWMEYSNATNQRYDVTLIETEVFTNVFPLTWIGGSGHEITIGSDGTPPQGNRPIVVGYTWDRWEIQGNDAQLEASDITFTNLTEHTVELTEHSSNITGSSVGPVEDNGNGNQVE